MNSFLLDCHVASLAMTAVSNDVKLFYIKNSNDAMQKEYFYQLLNIYPLSADLKKPIYQILLYPIGESLPYKAGQYIEIQYPDGSFHPFSIANALHPQGQLELIIKSNEEDLPTQKFLDHISEKGKVKILGPFGSCTYEKLLHHPSLLLSGGVGFSQSKAVIEQLILSGHKEPVHLYWGVKDPSSLYLTSLISQWEQQLSQFKYTFVFFEPQSILKSHEKNGYIHEAVIEDYTSLKNHQILISGPKEMIFAAKTLFQAGLDEKHLYSDWFDFL